MKRLKGGPEIKMPTLKVPGWLRDLYYDLDDRHLLPVVIVLIAAIIAVPVLLSGNSESEPVTEAAAAPAAQQGSSIQVSEATPRLRDYKRRLAHRSPQNPFGSSSGGGKSAKASSADEEAAPPLETAPPASPATSSGSEGAVSPSGGAEGAPSPEPSRPPEEAVPSHTETRYFSYAIDVRVVPVSVDGKPNDAEPTVRKQLPPWTMLPSRDVPALTYIGPTKDGKKALMLVSSDVTSLFGDSKCAVGSETCQLLALEEGAPETVVYGPNSKTYRIELRKIELVASEDLRVSPLGEPEKSKGKGSGSGEEEVGKQPEPRHANANSLALGVLRALR